MSNVEDHSHLAATEATLDEPPPPHLSIAHAIAISFSQLYTTSWLNQSEMSISICVPVSADGQRLLHEQAFVGSSLHHDPDPDERVFGLFVLLHLEVCHHKSLEEYSIFKSRPGSKTDPLFRDATAKGV